MKKSKNKPMSDMSSKRYYIAMALAFVLPALLVWLNAKLLLPSSVNLAVWIMGGM